MLIHLIPWLIMRMCCVFTGECQISLGLSGGDRSFPCTEGSSELLRWFDTRNRGAEVLSNSARQLRGQRDTFQQVSVSERKIGNVTSFNEQVVIMTAVSYTGANLLKQNRILRLKYWNFKHFGGSSTATATSFSQTSTHVCTTRFFETVYMFFILNYFT